MKSVVLDRQTREALAAERAGNLRQLLLAASRVLNRMVVTRLHERGYKTFKSTHLGLYSNIDFEGTRLGVLARRANMTKQAMWQLARELRKSGYIDSHVDGSDRRARIIRFTDLGWKLKLDNIEVFRQIESDLEMAVGKRTYKALREALRALSALDGAKGTESPGSLGGQPQRRTSR